MKHLKGILMHLIPLLTYHWCRSGRSRSRGGGCCSLYVCILEFKNTLHDSIILCLDFMIFQSFLHVTYLI